MAVLKRDIIFSLVRSESVPMPNETNDQLGDEYPVTEEVDQRQDGPEVAMQTGGQGMDGQDAVQDTGSADALASSNEPSVTSEGTTQPRVIRKLNAADFKIRPGQNPETGNEPKVQPTQEDVQSPVEQNVEPVTAEVPETKAEPEPKDEPYQFTEPVRYEPIGATPVNREPIGATPVEPVPVVVGASTESRPPENDADQMSYQPRSEPYDDRPVESEQPNKKNTTSNSIVDAIKGAISFFTIIKLNVGEKEISAFNYRFYVAPVVGFIIGIIAALIGYLFFEINAGVFATIAVFATIYILTKFLHFDGLVDFGDGMIVSGTKEDRIRALKDTAIGAGGLGVALIVTIAAIFGLNNIGLTLGAILVVVTMEVFAKNAMVSAAAFGEPGTGMAGDQVGKTNIQTLMVSSVISVILALAGFLIMGLVVTAFVDFGIFASRLIPSIFLIVGISAGVSILIGWFMAYLSNTRFGFVNGDVLGATNEISRVLVILISVIVIFSYTIVL